MRLPANASRTGVATAAARIVTSREARELRAQFPGRTTHGKTHHHRHGRPAHHRQGDPALPPRQAGEKGGRRVRGPPQIGHSRRQAGRRPGLSRDEKAVVQDLRRLWGSHREIVVVCSDNELFKIRKNLGKGYGIPNGGFYRWVTCPNYLGEILEWIGWAIACWSLAGCSFAIWVIANLVPRARSNHQWYHEQFKDYPKKRKILVPFIW